ncbi:hypothetical protein [Winogradskyella poriferorum]|uniref:hypothetical protein n=1 Tax=Winogradskyella poriferorum TaxID=307627 RepID=UPI003D65C626
MNKDYTKFKNQYSLLHDEISKSILEILVDSFNEFSFEYVNTKVGEYFYNYSKEIKLFHPDYKTLTSNFQNRFENFKQGKEFLVFEEHTKKDYKEIPNPISWEELPLQLAKREVYYNTRESWKYYNPIYGKMYDEFKFDKYENLPVFSILEKTVTVKEHPLYKELFDVPNKKSKSYIVENSFENFVTLPIYREKNYNAIIETNHFGVPVDYKFKLGSRKFFNYLGDEFINCEKTNYLDFLKVLFIDPEYHRSSIHFLGTNQLCCLLIYELQKDKIIPITQDVFGKFKLLINKSDKPISQSAFSTAANMPSKKDYESNKGSIQNAINYLNKIVFEKR